MIRTLNTTYRILATLEGFPLRGTNTIGASEIERAVAIATTNFHAQQGRNVVGAVLRLNRDDFVHEAIVVTTQNFVQNIGVAVEAPAPYRLQALLQAYDDAQLSFLDAAEIELAVGVAAADQYAQHGLRIVEVILRTDPQTFVQEAVIVYEPLLSC